MWVIGGRILFSAYPCVSDYSEVKRRSDSCSLSNWVPYLLKIAGKTCSSRLIIISFPLIHLSSSPYLTRMPGCVFLVWFYLIFIPLLFSLPELADFDRAGARGDSEEGYNLVSMLSMHSSFLKLTYSLQILYSFLLVCRRFPWEMRCFNWRRGWVVSMSLSRWIFFKLHLDPFSNRSLTSAILICTCAQWDLMISFTIF